MLIHLTRPQIVTKLLREFEGPPPYRIKKRVPLTYLSRRYNRLVASHLGIHFSLFIDDLVDEEVLYIDQPEVGGKIVYTKSHWDDFVAFERKRADYLARVESNLDSDF